MVINEVIDELSNWDQELLQEESARFCNLKCNRVHVHFHF